MSCGVGCRHGLDPVLLWLWCRPAAAAPIQLLAWELPFAIAVAMKKKTQNPNNLVLIQIHLVYRFDCQIDTSF